MAVRDDRAYINEALDAIGRASAFMGELSLDAFLEDEKTQSAVVRQIEIVGEACGKVSRSLRAAHPEIPWAEIVAMRNYLIHEYFGVDPEMVWETVRQDLPGLAAALRGLLEQGRG